MIALIFRMPTLPFESDGPPAINVAPSSDLTRLPIVPQISGCDLDITTNPSSPRHARPSSRVWASVSPRQTPAIDSVREDVVGRELSAGSPDVSRRWPSHRRRRRRPRRGDDRRDKRASAAGPGRPRRGSCRCGGASHEHDIEPAYASVSGRGLRLRLGHARKGG